MVYLIFGEYSMIDYIIVEDNKFHLEKLEKLIIKYMMRNKLEFNINAFISIFKVFFVSGL